MKLVQINLQPHFGGGEVYAAFLCRALSQLGVPTRLLVDPRAGFWDRFGLPADTERIAVVEPADLKRHRPAGPLWLLSHGPLPARRSETRSTSSFRGQALMKIRNWHNAQGFIAIRSKCPVPNAGAIQSYRFALQTRNMP
jgi:hypothetical protein